MEWLVPELLLRPRAENPVADPRHRGRNHQLPDQIGPLTRDGLGDAAADVITGEHRPAEFELLDQRDDAARLCGRGVLADRLRRVPVRLAEPPEIRHDDRVVLDEHLRQRRPHVARVSEARWDISP